MENHEDTAAMSAMPAEPEQSDTQRGKDADGLVHVANVPINTNTLAESAISLGMPDNVSSIPLDVATVPSRPARTISAQATQTEVVPESESEEAQEPAAQQSSAQEASEQQQATVPPRAPWYAFVTPALGKMVRWASRLSRHGGSALPGQVIERFDRGFLARTLAELPYGVVLVSGTNGKTTTTRMVASVLESLGLRVFTNPTGSNFTRGVVSALLGEVDLKGRLDADIAVLELDEAYAVHFVKQFRPRYSLLLNVMRDQLDRFGEIDNTARLLSHVAQATSGTVVLNREDARIAHLAADVPHDTKVAYFGLVNSLRVFFPSDDDMHASDMAQGESNAADRSASARTGSDVFASARSGMPAPGVRDTGSPRLNLGRAAFESTAQPADVVLKHVGDHEAEFLIDGRAVSTSVKLEGVYNLFNAAAALAVVRAVAADSAADNAGAADSAGDGDSASSDNGRAINVSAIDTSAINASDERLMHALAQVTPAFGRGEVIDVNGTPVELLLVKNPMGFRLSLASFPPENHDTMIAICDEYADGRDMSWLWDVDFGSLRGEGVAMVSGTRAWDMALRLEYDQVPVGQTDTDLEQSVESFVTANPGRPKHMYCTYTAMLRARSALSHFAQVADAGVGR
jgi:UDP-N-acetylmuramyl tripeptide synthase